jgi:hypothetical protein
MELEKRKVGELVALVGVVLAFIAVWTPAIDVMGFKPKYADDGTVMAAAIIVLGLAACCLLASILLGKANLDLTAAVAGAAGFGFFLYQPSIMAFKYIDKLSWGAWLGICAVLIPLGAGAAHFWHRRSDAKAPGVTLWTVAAVIGLVLIVIGIWSARFEQSGMSVSYWKSSASGHALGLLLLLLVIVSAVLIAVAVNARKAELADLALIVSAVLVGVAIAQVVGAAFGKFGNMGTGAWLELFGGLVLLLALTVSRVVKLPELVKK